ncbi:MAG: hypothetical protein H6719_08075 [Sandaracinaceae bacterium]|nr:hypothetical protein [Sandaracinaceae bacterium]
MLHGRKTGCGLLVVALILTGCDDGRMTGSDGSVPPGTDGGGPPPGTDGGGPPPGTDAGPPPPMSALVDPDCTDGMFTEALPDPTADLSDLEAAYTGSDPRAFIEAVLGRRYSTGRELVVNGNSPGIGDCVELFLSDPSTPTSVYEELSTIVHECGHFYDLSEGGADAVYVINDSPLRLSCSGGDTVARGGSTYERSRIRNDEYQSLNASDFYADIYLDGNPDDSMFDGGDQGFDSLLEETVQYVNSLASSYAFTNELNTGGASSQRDGILTFLWYVERYLHMARLTFPSAYDHILNGDAGCWRNAILTVWGRAWLYLETTRGMGHLGINDAMLEGLVMDAELLGEIQRLRDAAGCPAP